MRLLVNVQPPVLQGELAVLFMLAVLLAQLQLLLLHTHNLSQKHRQPRCSEDVTTRNLCQKHLHPCCGGGSNCKQSHLSLDRGPGERCVCDTCVEEASRLIITRVARSIPIVCIHKQSLRDITVIQAMVRIALALTVATTRRAAPRGGSEASRGLARAAAARARAQAQAGSSSAAADAAAPRAASAL